jgi:hypothetical protein
MILRSSNRRDEETQDEWCGLWAYRRLDAGALVGGQVGQGWAADDAAGRGTVADPLGARVSNAAVTLLLDGKVVKDVASDAEGNFTFNAHLNFGNSLLLPNKDRNAGYQKMDVSGSYVFNRTLKAYTTIENFLDQHYEPAFGFPGLPLNVRAGVIITLGGR